jgi:hypothetical protein
MRKIWILVPALLVIAAGALLQALKSESFVLKLAYGGVDYFTDLRLEMRNPHINFYAGSLSADELHLIPKATSGPALISVLNLEARVNYKDLFNSNLVNSSLSATQLLVYVSKQDEATDPSPISWLAYLRWLPRALRIEQMHVISAAADTLVLPLKQLYGDRLGGGHYRATANIDYEGEPVGAVLDVYALIREFGVRGANLKLALDAPLSASQITLEGLLEADAADFHYDFKLDGKHRDLEEFARGLPGMAGLAGAMLVNGRMVGDGKGFILSDAHFSIDNKPGYQFEATGSLNYDVAGKHSLELAAHGEMASLDLLASRLGIDFGDLGSVQGSASVGGTLEQPVMNWFSVATQNNEGLLVRLSGQLDLFSQDRIEQSATHSQVHIDMGAPSLAALEHWLEPQAYDPGPWHISADLVETGSTIALENIAASAGREDSLAMAASGRIGLLLQRGVEAQDGFAFRVQGIDLTVNARTSDSARLGEFLDRELPANHSASADFKLTGEPSLLQVSDGKLKVTSKSLDATITSVTLIVHPGEEQLLSGLSATINASLSGTSAIANYGAFEVPELGPVSLQARLNSKGSLFQLRDIALEIRQENMAIKATGNVGDLASLADIAMQSNFTAVDTRTLLGASLGEFNYPRTLGALSGTFKLRKTGSSWNIENLVLENTNSEGQLDLSAEGDIRDITGLPQADLYASFRIADPDLLELLSGLRMHPVAGDLRMSADPAQLTSQLTATVGTTMLTADSHIAYKDKRIDGVSLALAIPNLLLADFGFQPAATKSKQNQNDEAEQAPKQPLSLADLKAKSPAYPLDVSVKIDGIIGDNTNIERFEVHLTGKDHSYTLDQFALWYDNAVAELRGIVDLSASPPAISIAGSGLAIPLGSLTSDMGITTNISGSLSVLGGLTARGTGTPQLLQSLSGSLAIALEDAVIEGAAYDLLATDLLEWIYSGAMTDKSTYLDCTMAKFLVKDGIAISDNLYIESSKMVATGDIELDLVKQKLDMTLVPRSKSRKLQIPSTVRIHGKLDKLKPEISPVTALADASAMAVLLVPNLAMKLFNVNSDSGKSRRPCEA